VRLHIGLSFNLKKLKKWILLAIFSLLAFLGISQLTMINVHAEDTNVPWTSSESWFYTGTVYMDNGSFDYGSATWMKTVPINADWFWYNSMDCGNGNSTCIAKGVRSFSVGAKGANIKPDSYYKLIIQMDYAGSGHWTINSESINRHNMCAVYSGSSWNYGTSVCDVTSVSVSNDGKTVTAYVHTKTGADGLLLEVGLPSSTSKDSILSVWQNRSFDSVAIRIKTYQILLTNDLSGQLSDISGQLGSISGSIAGTNQKLEDVNQSITDVNDSLNNSNVDKNTGNDFFNNFNSSDNGGISGIVTAPLTLINGLLDNNSCQGLQFSVLNKEVEFPSGCMLWDQVPNNVEIVIQTLLYGIAAYAILAQLFKDIENLKDPNRSEVSTLDL